MPRRARMYVAGLAYHLVQRGNNRQACFIDPENYQVYLELWQQIAPRYEVAVHAYCLMTSHVHFLVTPQADTAVSHTMKEVGSRYAQYINKQYRRTGTLWPLLRLPAPAAFVPPCTSGRPPSGQPGTIRPLPAHVHALY